MAVRIAVVCEHVNAQIDQNSAPNVSLLHRMNSFWHVFKDKVSYIPLLFADFAELRLTILETANAESVVCSTSFYFKAVCDQQT